MRKHENSYYVRNPHGTVVIVGESELEHIKLQKGFEILEKIPVEAQMENVPKIPPKDSNALECPVCGAQSKLPMQVAKHMKKEHPDEYAKRFPSTNTKKRK